MSPIEQGKDALETLFGGWAEPAEIANALKACGQDVLKETVEELFDRQAQGTGATRGAVAVGEGDALAIVGHDALRAEGGPVNVGSQVFESWFAAADRLDIAHPIQSPDFPRNLGEERSMIFLEGLFEPSAEAHGQDALGQEVLGICGSDPAQTIRGETAARDHAMNVRMVGKFARPGLEHSQEPEFGAEIFVVATDVQ